jgi:hypothetical protein
MTTGGWIIMALSVGGTTAFFLWTIFKVLRIPDEPEKLHGFDFHTPDEGQDDA